MNLKKSVKIIKNKYLIVGLLFIAWMLFFDSNNIFTIVKYKKDLQKVREEKAKLSAQIDNDATLLNTLKTDRTELINYAREQYLMKKDNEDIFLIIPQLTN